MRKDKSDVIIANEVVAPRQVGKPNLRRGGPGRPAGIPNKITQSVRDMVLTALEEAGGAAYLLERAKDPRTQAAFLTLVGRVLPLQVVGGQDGPVIFERIVREIVPLPAPPSV